MPDERQPSREPTARLPRAFLSELRPHIPEVSVLAVRTIMAEVPTYDRALDGPMGETIRAAVQMTLEGFLGLAARGTSLDVSAPAPVVKGAYALGAAESRSGRSIEALLAAYRIGARVSWRELSAAALTAGATADQLAMLAGMVFAYIDELSAATVAGHRDQEESSDRLLRQRRERLAIALVHGEGEEVVDGLVERSEWTPPRTLTAALLPHAQARPALSGAPDTSLVLIEAPLHHPDHTAVLLAGTGSRESLLRLLHGRDAVVGPTKPWRQVRSSYLRAVRGLELPRPPASDAPLDTNAHLPELVVTADRDAWLDLRARALTPLASLSESSRTKLTDTLRAWLLHQGRRDAVAAELFVHAQTVRYRMGQLRDLFGDALDDPRRVQELVLALTAPDDPEDRSSGEQP